MFEHIYFKYTTPLKKCVIVFLPKNIKSLSWGQVEHPDLWKYHVVRSDKKYGNLCFRLLTCVEN